jgi:hypothetical protein
MQPYFIAFWAVFSLWDMSGWQDSNSLLEQSLRNQFQGKVLTLRHFYADAKLQFDADGNLSSSGKEGSWTTCGRLKIDRVNVSKQKITMKGSRSLLQYDEDSKTLFDAAEDQDTSEKQRMSIKWAQRFQMEISLAPEPARAERLKAALFKIFLTSAENLGQIVPDSWKLFVSRMTPPTKEEVAAAISKEAPGYVVRSIGEKGVIEPEVIRNSLPRYTTHARLVRASGRIVLSAVIDANGKVTKPMIVIPIGIGDVPLVSLFRAKLFAERNAPILTSDERHLEARHDSKPGRRRLTNRFPRASLRA